MPCFLRCFTERRSPSPPQQNRCRVVLGVHSGDHAIYPDCRPEFYTALEHAFAIGNWDSDRISFTLPYLEMDKADPRDAENAIRRLGLNFDEVFRRTLTSYQPDKDGRSDGTTGPMLNEFWHSMPSVARTLLNTSSPGTTCWPMHSSLNESTRMRSTKNG